MDTKNQHTTLTELADRIRLLPNCIASQACAEPIDDYESFLWYKTNIAEFGQRIVQIAGLLVAGIYLHEVRRPKKFERDSSMEDYIGKAIFGSGYDRGTACAILQRAGMLKSAQMLAVVSDDRPITRFTEALLDRPSNRLRSDLQQPIEDRLAAMLESLAFISQFQFQADGEVRYKNHSIDLAPFLLWDGLRLLRLDHVVMMEHADSTIVLADFLEPDATIRNLVNKPMQDRLNEIAGRFNLPSMGDNSEPRDSFQTTTSIVPSFADTHPQMVRLAQMIWSKSENSTKRRLWLPDRYKNSREDAEEYLSRPEAELFVTNQIIKKCLDEDPISVLEEYLTLEQGDIDEYIIELSANKEEADQICSAIEQRTAERRNMLGSFFCRQRDIANMESHLHRFYTRIAAQQIVKLMGFTILEVPMEEDVSQYIDRARAFQDFLTDDFEDHNWQKVGGGLLACAVATERILQFLFLFYKSLPFYNAEEADGLSMDGRMQVDAIRSESRGKGLAYFLAHFKEMNSDEEIRRTIGALLERDSIWPAGAEEQVFPALWALNELRIKLVHGQMTYASLNSLDKSSIPKIKEAQALVHGFQVFLDWLRNPTGATSGGVYTQDSTYPLRIYPEIVALHLQTKTRSGITSVRYTLRDVNDETSEVRLYTSQGASVDGCYYGLPHSKKVSRDLWVNPILIKTDVLVGE